MSKGKTLDKILNRIYEELYKHATPQASFKKLLKEANWVDSSGNTAPSDEVHTDSWYKENGYKKDIHYKEYVIDKSTSDRIVNDIIDEYPKLTPFDIKTLIFNLSKGCGPLTDEEKAKIEDELQTN